MSSELDDEFKPYQHAFEPYPWDTKACGYVTAEDMMCGAPEQDHAPDTDNVRPGRTWMWPKRIRMIDPDDELGPPVAKMITYELARPSGTVLAQWVVSSQMNFGAPLYGDGAYVGGELVMPPWRLRARIGDEGWITLAERPEVRDE